jgi:hypothetical protein
MLAYFHTHGIDVCGYNLKWKDELSFEVFVLLPQMVLVFMFLFDSPWHSQFCWLKLGYVHLVPYANVSYLTFEIDA